MAKLAQLHPTLQEISPAFVHSGRNSELRQAGSAMVRQYSPARLILIRPDDEMFRILEAMAS
jgi:hypothetical protein